MNKLVVAVVLMLAAVAVVAAPPSRPSDSMVASASLAVRLGSLSFLSSELRRDPPEPWRRREARAQSRASEGWQSAIEYRLRFPEPEHRWMQVEVTFPEVPRDRALELRMSRSSPGRYALHEFSKNVFEIHAYDSRGRELAIERPDAYQWNVGGHDGAVRVVYSVYGDHIDGTYLAVDTTHAHLNMPASLMWARGLHDRPARVTFEAPTPPGWTVATQLYPTSDPLTFTAPNFQYLMDSPAEVGPLTIRDFVTKGPDGAPARFRLALHHDGSEADARALAADVEHVAREEAAVFGEFPAYEPGGYTFLLDYLPYAAGDGMEHRNSTVITSRLSTANPSQRRAALNTIAHELFHCWNVERIRPRSLEPFDFEQANTSGELWLAEGFTTYYAALVLQRARLATLDETIPGFGMVIDAVVNTPARRFRSAVDVSRMAPFVDAARSVDRTNVSSTFLSYYTFGAAIGLGLDLTLRDRSDGRVTLDDYMRALWRAYGRPGGPAPGLVARPYTLADLRDRLADVSGDRGFADGFFDRFIEGREVVDYARLAGRAGLVLRKRRPGRAWIGALGLERAGDAVKIGRLVPFGSPAYAAGLEQDDVVVSVSGRAPASSGDVDEALDARKPGDRVDIVFERRGKRRSATLILAEDPGLELVTLERAGGTPTDAQHAFRHAWMRSQVR